MADFDKYGLMPAFWEKCSAHFGYTDNKPSPGRLVNTLFLTYAARDINGEPPRAWRPFISRKSGNIIVFMDSFMNNVNCRESYDRLSAYVEQTLSVENALKGLPLESLIECDSFLCVDRLLQKWICGRLCDEDIGTKLDGLDIPEICELRKKKHFAEVTEGEYNVLEAAWHLIASADYRPAEGFTEIEKRYISEDYRLDSWYRSFIRNLDSLEDVSFLGRLPELVENIYTNEYLDRLLHAWNEALDYGRIPDGIPLQTRFYQKYVKNLKERTVVIISDGMRFETGAQLARKLQDDPAASVKLEAQLSVLPSYTALGMAALLPHRSIEMTDSYEVLIDGQQTGSLAAREKVLQSWQPQGVCIRFDTLMQMKSVAELRSVLTGRQPIYVYHNQIDTTGENAGTENEVFDACETAVNEIAKLIHRIAVNGNTHRFLVTSDHGFLYKREALKEGDKISHSSGSGAFKDRRFIIDREPVGEEGVMSVSLGEVLGNDDTRQVSFPVSACVFAAGGGMNYVHGGSSPQEMIVPVLDIKMERYHTETHSAGVSLLSTVSRITALKVSLDFVQTEAVCDTVTAAAFRICFFSADDEKISNECVLNADSRDEDQSKRITRLTFTFRSRKYNPSEAYYLVIENAETGMEVLRVNMVIDIPFADDYGFGF